MVVLLVVFIVVSRVGSGKLPGQVVNLQRSGSEVPREGGAMIRW
jgi:hypothetical protein